MTIRFVVFKCLNPAIKLMDAFVPSPEETYICCWGALRGAVGLALGLVVWGNKMENFGKIDDVYVRAKRVQRAIEPEKSEATKKSIAAIKAAAEAGCRGGSRKGRAAEAGCRRGCHGEPPTPPAALARTCARAPPPRSTSLHTGSSTNSSVPARFARPRFASLRFARPRFASLAPASLALSGTGTSFCSTPP
jgi:hypothetical protein